MSYRWLTPFHRQIIIIPVQHSSLEIRDVLEAETGKDGGGRGAAYSGPADSNNVPVLVAFQLARS